MNDQPSDNQNEPLDWRAERRQRREERRAARHSGTGGTWIAGIILIGLGVLLLLQNLKIFSLTNWWALFILIPAVAAFGTAWRAYQAAGNRLTAAARGELIGGLILLALTAVFLFGLNLGIIGPILLMLAGVGMVLNFVLP